MDLIDDSITLYVCICTTAMRIQCSPSNPDTPLPEIRIHPIVGIAKMFL